MEEESMQNKPGGASVPSVNWLERLGKWRALLTGRLLGTRLITDPQARGARDLFDKLNALAADARAMQTVLVTKGVTTRAEFMEALGAGSPAQREAADDIFETLLKLRAEVNAVTYLLLHKGVVSDEEYTRVLMSECKWLCEDYEQQFPGFKATDVGLTIDTRLAAQTTQGWPK
jgi:hypothetical protein